MGRLLLALLLVGAWSEAAAQYGGPSLLSRGGNSPGRRGRALQKLNGYVSVRGIYESGMRAARLEDTGEITSVDSPGALIEAGVYGGKDWRRVSVGVDYRGDYRHMTNTAGLTGFNNLNGTNQVIAIDTSIRASRRTLVTVSETGGTTNRAFGAFSAPAFGDTDRLGVPLNEVFDVRTYFTQAEVTATNQRTARLAVMGSASGFFVRREGFALINAQGYRVSGGLAYRTSRRTMLISRYQWMNFAFPRLSSESNVHGISLGVQHRFSPNWELSALAGTYLISSSGAEQVVLSPEVAAILGRRTGEVFFRRNELAPLVDIKATYTQERGRFVAAAASAVVPGNGVYLTSTRQNVHVGYSYSGTKRLSLGINGGYWRNKSAALSLGDLRSWQAGGGITYRLVQGLDFMTQFDRRTFNTLVVGGRNGYAVSIGLAYHPSRFPLSIW